MKPLFAALTFLPLTAAISLAGPGTADPTAVSNGGVPGGNAAGGTVSAGGSASGAPQAGIGVAPGLVPALGGVPSAPARQKDAPAQVMAAGSGAEAAVAPPAGEIKAEEQPISRAEMVRPPGSGAASVGSAAVSPASARSTALPPPRSPRGARSPGSPPAAGAALGRTAREIAKPESDDFSVKHELDAAFFGVGKEAAGRAAGGSAGGVIGRIHGVRERIEGKIRFANKSSPADAPRFYQEAIDDAKESLPPELSAAVEAVVRRAASRKAVASAEPLAQAVCEAAAKGQANEVGRLLSAFERWETVVGSPVVTNLSMLKAVSADLLAKAKTAVVSAPHVWLARSKKGAYIAGLPLPSIPAFSFSLSRLRGIPESALAEAYRDFVRDPNRASTGARAIYRARRALGSSVPAAALSAARYWFWDVIESFWRRIVALFRGGPAYDVSDRGGRRRLRQAAALAAVARAESARAERLLSTERLTVGAAREAFDAADRAAAACDALAGGPGIRAEVSDLRKTFDSLTRGQGARQEVSPDVARWIADPGGLVHWLEVISISSWDHVDAESVRGAGAEVTDLGGSREALAAAAKIRAISPATRIVVSGDSLMATAPGVRLTADLRPTASGGGIELSVARRDAALARRLEEVGLSVTESDAGLLAVLGRQDAPRAAEAIGALATRALAAISEDVRGERARANAAMLRRAAESFRRDRAGAKTLSAKFERAALERGRLIGEINGERVVLLDDEKPPIAVMIDSRGGPALAARVDSFSAR